VIGSLRGVLLDRVVRGEASAEILVEVSGVGYRAVVPTSSLGQLGELGSAVFLHVHTHVREDAIILYGFPTREERACFEVLLSAHGVGPAVALAMLSVHSPRALRRAVASDDIDALTLVPGVGKRTAARLLIELKARLDVIIDDPELGLVGSVVGSRAVSGGVRSELRAALAGLGYGPDEVRDVLADLPEEGTLEDLLRGALRQLASQR
jgi:Holliday junction DNA helicase RuvA